jgi:hypothetical protein
MMPFLRYFRQRLAELHCRVNPGLADTNAGWHKLCCNGGTAQFDHIRDNGFDDCSILRTESDLAWA